MNRDRELAKALAACFEKHMLEEYIPRIRKCVGLLSEEQAWRRPSKHGNSVANLLLHLRGNTRQWILSGIGGQPDRRDRDLEFAAGPDAERRTLGEIFDRLEATVTEAVGIVAALGAEDLLAERDFQGGGYHGNGLSGVLHVLEHFSGHAGQIYTQTKQLTELDLGFYADLDRGDEEKG